MHVTCVDFFSKTEKLLRLILDTVFLIALDARGQSRATLDDLHEMFMFFFQKFCPSLQRHELFMSGSLSFQFILELACTLVKTHNIISPVAALIDRLDRWILYKCSYYSPKVVVAARRVHSTHTYTSQLANLSAHQLTTS